MVAGDDRVTPREFNDFLCTRDRRLAPDLGGDPGFFPEYLSPSVGPGLPDHPHMATETWCHHTGKQGSVRHRLVCLLGEGLLGIQKAQLEQELVMEAEMSEEDTVQCGTTGPEMSVYSLRALGISLRLVQPVPSWRS